MKGIQVSAFGESDVLTLLDIADPVMGEKDICIRLKAAGVNPVETYIRSGNYGALPNLPYTPGSDGAGIIERVGAKVEGFQIGERVFVSTIGGRGTGTYAQKIVCEADSVYHLPDELSFEEGAALGTSAFTAVQALYQKAKILPGEYVLIHGASGGVGSLALQLAKLSGSIVIATAGSQKGLKLLSTLGADVVLNHHQVDYLRALPTLTKGHGVDVVIEMLANVNLQRDLEIMAKHGRIVVVGNRGSLEINPRLAMNQESQIMGMLLANMTDDQKRENGYRLKGALNHGVKPVIDHVFSLAEARMAHELVISQRESAGKIVLKID